MYILYIGLCLVLRATTVEHLINGLVALTVFVSSIYSQNRLKIKDTAKNYLRSFNVHYFVFTFVI